MKNLQTCYFLINFLFIGFVLNQYPVLGQQQALRPRIYLFYPEHAVSGEGDFDSRRILIEQGKWQVDTVVCSIVKFADTTLGGRTFEIADTVFTRAMNEWNNSGMRLYLKKRLVSSRSVTGNVFSFDNRQIPRGDSNLLGSTVPILFDTVRINNILYFIPQVIHVEINRETWNSNQGLNVVSRTMVDVFETATHELGHFIGFGNHDYPENTSIMSIATSFLPFNGLAEIDKKYARSFYPNILPQHQNDCTPR